MSDCMDYPGGLKEWPLFRGGHCKEVAVSGGSSLPVCFFCN